MNIGITERGDPVFDLSWMKYTGYKILITKDVNKLLSICRSENLDKTIVHCTITGLGGTVFEPNVPKPEIELKAYKNLVDMLGPERVVLRVDPIFPEDSFWVNYHKPIIEQCVSRLRISFLDLYSHVKDNLGDLYSNINHETKHANLISRILYWQEIQDMINDVEICGEPSMECTGCVSVRDFKALGISEDKIKNKTGMQRNECKCCGNKFELLNNSQTCKHGCLYCYWYS